MAVRADTTGALAQGTALVAADDRQKGPEPFVMPVASERFDGIV